MSSTESFEAKIQASKAFLDEAGLQSNERILIAFSGGPDSTALLCLFHNELINPCDRIALAYFNHHLRGEEQADLESRHVDAVAERFGIPLFCGRAEPGEIDILARAQRVSVEEAARILRYRFFRKTQEIHGYGYIATGHTADDEIETLIQRFFQGSGVRGLCGIPRIAGDIIRPLFNWSRSDVDAYNNHNGVEAFIDPTNKETIYLRNHIRHQLIPAVAETFPNFDRSLRMLAKKMTLVRDYLDQAVLSKVEWKRDGERYLIPSAVFGSLHAIERVESVRNLINRVYVSDGQTLRIPFLSFSRLIDLPYLHNNAMLFRGCGYRVQVHGDTVVFEPDIVFEGRKGYFKVVCGDEDSGWRSSLPGIPLCIEKSTGEENASIPVAAIRFPLLVRSRREGDVITVGGMRKELKKLYNDWNVAAHDRWKIPVCEDRNGIIAVFGTPFGYKNINRFRAPEREESLSYEFKRC